jgi:ubiquinone/menaquinone biosynthesis C-methylase UbiE
MNAAPAPLARAPLRDVQFWDRIARKYAQDPVADPEGYARSVRRCQELLGPTARVLELGCGTGTTALQLAPQVAEYTGTDLSPEMITIAEEKRAAAGVSALRFVVSAATDPQAEDGRYDAVLAMNLLHLVPDLGATLAQVYARLAPGGLFISKTACLSDMNPLIRLVLPLMRWVGKAPATVRCFTGGELEVIVRAAGFEVVAVERHASKGRDARPFIVARKPGPAAR